MMKDDSKNFQLRTDVRENGALRRSFDALAKKTFGLTFEGWYQSSGWKIICRMRLQTERASRRTFR